MDIGKTLLNEESYSGITMGNAAIVRAMIEAGVEVITSYPGSPTPEIAEAVKAVRSHEDIFYFEFSVNEKVAAEVAFGASISGSLSVVFFKSVGLNVASDSFVQFSLMDVKGGLVIVLGDDPGANSSQNEQDNRHFARMTNTPVLEPADPQQAYEMFIKAAALSVEHAVPVILRLTTHVCHAKSLISFGCRPPVKKHQWSFKPAFGEYIPLTKAVAGMKKRSIEKFRLIKEYTENSEFNKIVDNGSGRGIITCGLPSLSLYDLLEETASPPDILILGSPWPLPENLIIKFCTAHEQILILEELDPFIEKEVKAAAYDAGLTVPISGKTDAEDFIGELTALAVRRFLRAKWPELGIPEASETGTAISPRPAQMCPGCGHRSAFFAIKKALGPDDITVADIGCHTLGYLPPYNIGQVLLSMGHSNGTGAGLSLFQEKGRTLTLIGDSTFFHAGFPGIVNAVYNRHNITLIVMANGTTAMTGHQDHAGSRTISIKAVLEALGVEVFGEIDTYKQKELTEAVKKALNFDGFSAVIARHPCMLKITNEKRRKGILPSSEALIDEKKCRNIRICSSDFACPSFNVNPDSGIVYVNSELCIGDGSCVQTCPTDAILLERKKK